MRLFVHILADFWENLWNLYIFDLLRKKNYMNTENVIGRKQEIDTLARLFNSKKSEFLAIYGRRRVGKSYLIEEAFRDDIVFSAVGIYRKKKKGLSEEQEIKEDSSYKELQLKHFYANLLQYGLDLSMPAPSTWLDAFVLLRTLISKSTAKRKVVFIDELPWLGGPQSSELVEELGYFWNNWAVKQRNVFLVVCGSATSWMLDNVIRDYGGLHGRVTHKLLLKPFTLAECKAFYEDRNFRMSDYEIALAYMAIGGVPYYMDMFRNDYTLTQNLNMMYFKNDTIATEFEDVYTGLFSSSERYIDIVRALSKKFYGMTRSEILEATKLKGGGTVSKILDNLKECGIIRTYPKYGASRKVTVYQLTDFFSLFYLNFVDSKAAKYEWNSFLRSNEHEEWAGRAFEILCSLHREQIEYALRIKNAKKDYMWQGASPSGKGAQVDMVIPAPMERTDYLCEMKYSENKFAISSSYQENLCNKIDAFKNSKQHKPSHSILLVMVTTMGLANSVNNGVVNVSLTLDDLLAF